MYAYQPPVGEKMTVVIDSCFETYAYILGKLRHDENKYVRRSVANNLNDLFKYDAVKAQSIIDTWYDEEPNPPKDTLEVIKHGMRSHLGFLPSVSFCNDMGREFQGFPKEYG